MMWMLLALLSAFFAAITTILAKVGIIHTDSTIATALRTIVVFFFSWIMVALVGSFDQMSYISNKTFIFLMLSGLSTGASWLCYFKALQLGEINKVIAIDKLSVFFTIVFAFVLLNETVSGIKILGLCLLVVGTYLMIERKEETKKKFLLNGLFMLLCLLFLLVLHRYLEKWGLVVLNQI